jgi:hypothetical protein
MVNPVSKVKSTFYQNVINFPGWRTRRKIVVIESDDWGSIRMPSNEVYAKFISKGLNLSGSVYNRIDSLECNDDLDLLFSVLLNFKDSNGKHPALTANIVVGNPDFKKISDSDFTDYYYEPVTETVNRYPDREKVISLWKQGNSEEIFHPQFHCREHVNIIRWMGGLRKRTSEIMFAFDNQTTFSGNGDYNFMEVLDYNSPGDLVSMKQSIVEGLDLFERIFGFRSRSFIPPCYTWNSDVEATLANCGVKYIQGLVVQSVPTGSFGNYKKKYHFFGHRNSHGQYFLIRNCFFEPSLSETSDPVGECMNRIRIAFRWQKPAIICSHRINFVGSLDKNNRGKNLELLSDLLSRITKTWPDVEFLTSDQLGDLIARNY